MNVNSQSRNRVQNSPLRPPRSPTDGEQNFIVNGNDDFSSSSSFDRSSSAAPDVGFSLPKFKSKQMHNKVSRPTDRLCKVYLFSDQNGIRSLMRISISNCHPRSRAAESDSWRGFSKASAPHRTRTKALSSGLMLRAALPPSLPPYYKMGWKAFLPIWQHAVSTSPKFLMMRSEPDCVE